MVAIHFRDERKATMQVSSSNASAKLLASQTVAQFVLEQVLKGLELEVIVDGSVYRGTIHNLDFDPGSDHLFAQVTVPELVGSVSVAVYPNGVVEVMDGQVGLRSAASCDSEPGGQRAPHPGFGGSAG